MRKTIFFLMAFLGTFAGNIIRVETAARAYFDVSSVFFLTLFTAGFMVGRAIAALIVGDLFDRKPIYARNIMVLSFLLLGVMSLVYLFVPVWLYLLLRFLFGILSGLSWPIVQSILLISSKSYEKNRNMSVYFICGSLGMSIAFLLFAYLDMMTVGLVCMTLYMLTSCLGMLLRVDNKKDKRLDYKQAMNSGRGKVRIEYVILASELGLAAAIIATDTITGILLEKGFDEIRLGIILSLSSFFGILLGIFSSYISALVADRYGERKIFVFLSMLMLVSTISLIFSSNIIAVSVSIIMLKVFIQCFRPILIALARSSDAVGLNIGIINASHNIATVVFSPVLGLLIECEYFDIMLVLILIVVAMGILGGLRA